MKKIFLFLSILTLSSCVQRRVDIYFVSYPQDMELINEKLYEEIKDGASVRILRDLN